MERWKLWVLIQHAYFVRWLHSLRHMFSGGDHRNETAWWQPSEGGPLIWPPDYIGCKCGRAFWSEKWLDEPEALKGEGE